MKKLLIVIVVILALPIVIYFGLYAYGTYIVADGKHKLSVIDEKQTALIQSGNGFGGEAGFEIVDSKYYPSKYFWLDNDHLIFMKNPDGKSGYVNFDNFIWNIATNEIKKINMDGGVTCFRRGELFHFYNPDPLNANKELRRVQLKNFRSKLIESEQEWQLIDTQDTADIWPLPSERYTLEWSKECKPWFRLKTDKRTSEDVPEHRFEYLPEWNWIVRTPRLGSENFDQSVPEMGVFSIGDDIYSGQQGIKVADLPMVASKDLSFIQISYATFMDKYWMALPVMGDEKKQKYLAFLNKNGTYQKVQWVKNWKLYDVVPLPSKKGLVWDGYDYRLEKNTMYDLAGYIENNGVHKFVHGLVEHLSLSPDGCRVAFTNKLKLNKGKATLKVFNVCNSTINGSALNDAVY